MEKKRAHYTIEEKALLRRLVMKHRGVIENKKSDAVSVLEKKQVWEMVTEEYNSSAEPHNNRTSAQLRKLWDNIKFKRKMELAAERRQILKTGGGPQDTPVPEDPELDSLGNIDIELREAVDSDTVALAGTAATSYIMVNQTLMPVVEEDMASFEAEEEVLGETNDDGCEHVATPKGVPGRKPNLEVQSRLERNHQLLEHDRALYLSKMEEVELRKELMRKEHNNKEELFQLKKRKLTVVN
ncbi:hypothetical protein GE061_004311 [Apolygus lucorum]|uniref:Regulatory protein zeste n=1 Tax=Apolygus lucorum TaxID=248454 RepID=A0A8S9X2U2_APOLU|nr:hypothetical protein GE061_004311 [Apolygus lucorum]